MTIKTWVDGDGREINAGVRIARLSMEVIGEQLQAGAHDSLDLGSVKIVVEDNHTYSHYEITDIERIGENEVVISVHVGSCGSCGQ